MDPDRCFLAIDSGTSRMKAALIDERNRFIDLLAADLQVLHPFDGASEADMNQTWDTLCQLLRSLAKRNPAWWKAVVGIGVTGQGDGAWMVDPDGSPVRNAILWNDTRTKSTSIDFRDELNRYCQENCITPIFQGADYYILKWVKENEPDAFRRIARVVHCKDWLNFRLTGSLGTDYSDTSTSTLSSAHMAYDFKVLDFLGLEGLEGLFAPIHYSDEICGEVSIAAAAQTGLRPGIPVVAGSIDIAGVAAGAGAVEPGDTVAIIGTTCCVTMVLKGSQLDYSDRRGSILCHQARQRFLRLIAMSNGTASLDWVCRTVLPGAAFSEIEAGIGSIAIGSEGVIFHPYLYGERAPFREPNASGGFFGITARHTPLHLIRAAYEGLAMALSQCYAALPSSTSPIRIAGGGAANNVFCQIICDCLGKELRRSRIAELGLNGITKAIRTGLGMPAAGRDSESAEDVFYPVPANQVRYLELSQLYIESLRAMSAFWQARDTFLNSNKMTLQPED